MGVAFARESSALDAILPLLRCAAVVPNYCDPHVPTLQLDGVELEAGPRLPRRSPIAW